MAHYLQRERYLNKTVVSGGIVDFDLLVNESMTIDESELAVKEPDFKYHSTGNYVGAIDILRKGDYLILWGVDKITERPVSTGFMQLKQWIESPIDPGWKPMASVSTTLKAKNAVGFAILSKPRDEITTIALFNESEENITLSNYDDNSKSLSQKARIVILGLSEYDGDFSRLLELIELDECCYDLNELIDSINKITLREEDQYEMIEDLQVKFIELSNDYQFLNAAPTTERWPLVNPFNGWYLCCKRVGYIHFLWMEGSSSSPIQIRPNTDLGYCVLQAVDMVMTNEYGNKYYPFMTRFPYNTPLYGTGWLTTSSDIIEFPLRFEPPNSSNTPGLWIRSTSSINNIISLRFNMAVALARRTISTLSIGIFEGEINQINETITFKIPQSQIVSGQFTGIITALIATELSVTFKSNNVDSTRNINQSITIKNDDTVRVIDMMINSVAIQDAVIYTIKLIAI